MTEGYFVNKPFGENSKQGGIEMSEFDQAKKTIGEPMVEQLKNLAKKSSDDPVTTAQLLHNTLINLDQDFQAAACVVWNNLIIL